MKRKQSAFHKLNFSDRKAPRHRLPSSTFWLLAYFVCRSHTFVNKAKIRKIFSKQKIKNYGIELITNYGFHGKDFAYVTTV